MNPVPSIPNAFDQGIQLSIEVCHIKDTQKNFSRKVLESPIDLVAIGAVDSDEAVRPKTSKFRSEFSLGLASTAIGIRSPDDSTLGSNGFWGNCSGIEAILMDSLRGLSGGERRRERRGRPYNPSWFVVTGIGVDVGIDIGVDVDVDGLAHKWCWSWSLGWRVSLDWHSCFLNVMSDGNGDHSRSWLDNGVWLRNSNGSSLVDRAEMVVSSAC